MSVYSDLSSEKRTLFHIVNSNVGCTAEMLKKRVKVQVNTIEKNICHLRKKGVNIQTTMIQVALDTKIAMYWIDRKERATICERFGI